MDASHGIRQVPQTCLVSLDKVNGAGEAHVLGDGQGLGDGGPKRAIGDWIRRNTCGQHD